jgi:hypothetical protein
MRFCTAEIFYIPLTWNTVTQKLMFLSVHPYIGFLRVGIFYGLRTAVIAEEPEIGFALIHAERRRSTP